MLDVTCYIECGGVCTPCYMFLRVVACCCLLLLRVPACCCELLFKVWNRSNVWSNNSQHFFILVHDCWSGVFLRVAETIADSLVCCDVGFVQRLFNLLYCVSWWSFTRLRYQEPSPKRKIRLNSSFHIFGAKQARKFSESFTCVKYCRSNYLSILMA